MNNLFEDFLNENITGVDRKLFDYDGIEIFFLEKSDGTHTLESRLNRAKITEDILKETVTRLLKTIAKPTKPKYGLYLVDCKKFKIIAKFGKKQFRIITILTKQMKTSRNSSEFDYNYIMEFFNLINRDFGLIVEEDQQFYERKTNENIGYEILEIRPTTM